HPARRRPDPPNDVRGPGPMSVDRIPTVLSDDDLHLFNEGTHTRLWERLGAHPLTVAGREGMAFAVWAPNAERVTLIGDFNGWDPDRDALRPRASTGIWEGWVGGAGVGA